MSYTLELSGFETERDVELFLEWFGGSGEQDLVYWYDGQEPGRVDKSPVLDKVERRGKRFKRKLIVHKGNVVKASVRH